jgi:hypothetical protein
LHCYCFLTANPKAKFTQFCFTNYLVISGTSQPILAK